MAPVETPEWQVLSDLVWLIVVWCLLRRWPIRRPLKDTKVWCHHLQFSAVTSASKAGYDSDVIPLIFSIFYSSSSLSITIRLYYFFHICFTFRYRLSQKHFNQKTLRLNEKPRKVNSFFCGLQLDYLSIGLSGCKVKDWNCIHSRLDLAVPGGEQIEIDELIKSKWTPRQTAH